MPQEIIFTYQSFIKQLEQDVVFLILFIIFHVTVHNISSEGICCQQPLHYQKNRIFLSKLDHAINEYRSDTGTYPYSLSLLVYSKSDRWMGPYIREKDLTDTWQQPYQ